MKTSLRWLSDFVDVPWSARELAERLTAAGLELEGIEQVAVLPEGVLTAQIVERRKHENAEHLSVCQVDCGDGRPLQVVCGAPNCEAGQKVALATLGTRLGEGFIIKKAKLRGVESEGMLCSARELGLGDEHEGILILPPDTALGRPLQELFQEDSVIEWEITANRGDWLSHLGIAREIAAQSGASLKMPETRLRLAAGRRAEEAASVRIEAPELCPRYIARVFVNVKVGPSPDWMQQRLMAVGLRPINNVVDITNYVMLEYGQPLHAFDLEELAGAQIIVRRARKGEKICTLDGTELELGPENLLIADAERGVALAGIMGAENSMISADTCSVLLETAAFDPVNIRVSSRNLGISTDSSYRFERGVSPETSALASERAASLLCELAGAEQLEGVLDCYPRPWQYQEIKCRVAKVNALLGLKLDSAEIADCLKRRGLQVLSQNDEELLLRTPGWRFDLHKEVDLIEEVAQVRGLDSIPTALGAAKLGGSSKEDCYYEVEAARGELLALGLDEVMNYSLFSRQDCLLGGEFEEGQIIEVSNPISNDAACLRPSLLAGLLKVVRHNVAHNNHQIGVFEIGRVFKRDKTGEVECNQIGIAMSGLRHPERYGEERAWEIDFFSMKGLLESWLESRGLEEAKCEAAELPVFKKGACAAFQLKEGESLVFGELAESLQKGMRLRYPLFMAFANLTALERPDESCRKFVPLGQFPGTARDISFVAPPGLTHQQILDGIAGMKLKLLDKIELFDIYEDEKLLGPGRRSMAYSMHFSDPQRSLRDEEINLLQEKIRCFLAEELKVELR